MAPPSGSAAFCRDSGLVYNQTSQHAGGKYWVTLPRSEAAQAPTTSYPIGKRGASSLKNMARRSFCRHSWSLKAGYLDSVPYEQGRSLWKMLVTTGGDTFEAWKIFAVTYASEPGAEHLRIREQRIQEPDAPLSMYTEPLRSQTSQWLVVLSFQSVNFSRGDVLNLSQIPNLAALTIGAESRVSGEVLDDTVFRAWSRDATSNGGFPKLRVLALREQGLLTAQVFEHAWQFPKLQFVLLDDTKGNRIYFDPYPWMQRVDSKEAIDLLDSFSKLTWQNVIQRALNSSIEYPIKPVLQDEVSYLRVPTMSLELGPQQLTYGERGALRIFRKLSLDSSSQNRVAEVYAKDNNASQNSLGQKRRLKNKQDAAASLKEFGI